MTELPNNEYELIARAKQGDMCAFEALYHLHKTPIFRTALAISGDRHLAEEILQEVFLRAHKNIHRMHDDRSLAPWLYRVTVNLTYDITTRRNRGQTLLKKLADWLPSPLKSPEYVMETQELQMLVLQAINQLEIKQRTVLVLFYLQGFSMGEIAGITEVPVGTVKSRLHYARQNLRKTVLADKRLLGAMAYDHS